jgi:trehalose synthase
MFHLEDFRHIVSDQIIADIYAKARKFYGRHVVHLNATYQGGGVAEILYSLVMLMNDVGIDAGWRILHGSQEFFEITKSFHNALQGARLNLSERKKRVYTQTNEVFAHFTHLDHDCVIVHDPQPLALIQSYRKRQPWVWRCHIDLTEPHKGLWDFLKGFVLKYDLAIVSNEQYMKKDLPVAQRLIYPAINPLSPKNSPMSDKAVRERLAKAGVPTDKPIITQVSRLDPWKDPEGVIDVFQIVREQVDCRLVLCYNAASDDPEGLQMYKKVQRKGNRLLQRGEILLVVGNNEKLVNAIQKFSRVVLQKSTREGFCLAVTEAMWKGTPVVASRVGGIPSQIEDGRNGFLLDPMDLNGFADRIIHLLRHPKDGAELGQRAKETVREKFLITRLLADHLDVLDTVMA